VKRLRVLVSAYACHPLATEESFPGEAILGWNVVRQLCRFHDVTVLTRAYNMEALENGLRERGLEATCLYVTLPRALAPLLRHYLGFSLYYLFWQLKSFALARRLARERPFDVFHQVTFANDWMPSFIGAYLRMPFIWGPLGGAHRTPAALLPELGPRFRRKELVREALKDLWRATPFRRRGLERAAAILVCNRETETALSAVRSKLRFFPVNGIDAEELPPAPCRRRRRRAKRRSGGSGSSLPAGSIPSRGSSWASGPSPSSAAPDRTPRSRSSARARPRPRSGSSSGVSARMTGSDWSPG